MVLETLEIWERPFSINSMYYAQKAIKTQPAREWSYRVFEQLSSDANLEAMERIRNAFDPNTHNFEITLTAYYPKKKLLTKKGTVSAMSIDTTNWEKPLVDLVFLPKHRNSAPPFGCENIGYDDKYICSMSSKKVYWDRPDFKIIVTVELKNNECLYQPLKHDLDKLPASNSDTSKL